MSSLSPFQRATRDDLPDEVQNASHAAPALAPGAAQAETVEHERLPVETVRVSMGRVVIAWGFGAAFFNLTAGAIYTSFARRIGADERVLGLLFAALPLMSFLQVLSAWLIEKTGKRKHQMMVAGLTGRSLWLIIPLMPLLVQQFPDKITHAHMMPAVIACVLVSSAFQAFTGPAFFAWMADLVPGRVRPQFFAQRMRVGTLSAIFTALASGYIVDRFPDTRVYCYLLMLAGFCGIMDIALFFGVKEPPRSDAHVSEPKKTPPPWATIGEALRDGDVRRFLAFVSLLCVGYGLTGAISWLFVLEYLELSKTMSGLLLNIGPLLGIALTSRFWGEAIKRYGNRPVIRFCSLGLAFVPLGFITAQSESWFWLAVVTFLSGIFACGIELTNVNQITGLAPHVPRTTMTAIFSITAGLSMAGASLLGGQLAHTLKWVETMDFEVMGLPVANYHLIFGMTLLVRLLNAAFVAPRLQEPTATSTLEAVKEIVPELIQNLAERLARPVQWRSGD